MDVVDYGNGSLGLNGTLYTIPPELYKNYTNNVTDGKISTSSSEAANNSSLINENSNSNSGNSSSISEGNYNSSTNSGNNSTEINNSDLNKTDGTNSTTVDGIN